MQIQLTNPCHYHPCHTEIPEPSTGLLVLAVLLILGGLRLAKMAKGGRKRGPELTIKTWFRIYPNGPGLSLLTPSDPRLFSERHGPRKPLISWNGYRLFWLARIEKGGRG